MSTRSAVWRLAVFGLLLSRAPRWVQRVVAYMALGVAVAVVVIAIVVLSTAAHAFQCDVAAPFGRKLIVKDRPGGKQVATVNNGAQVDVGHSSTHKVHGIWWGSVGVRDPEPGGTFLGWARLDHLNCSRVSE